jgi:endonuclease/exonuclease/phosphatase family metal-dependent hydrolase
VDDTDDAGIVFSRDCPEYTITTPSGATLVLLLNHFKSKGFGKPADNDAKRLRQATRVAEIYTGLRNDGHDNIIVLGDFNDIPDAAPLHPLLGGTDLRDISKHGSFTGDPTRPGTFGNGTKSQKFDYILLSPALFAACRAGRLAQRRLGRQERNALGALPTDEAQTRPGLRPRRHLRRPRPLGADLWVVVPAL